MASSSDDVKRGHSIGEIENWNLDRTVDPPTRVIGLMGKSSGTWNYAQIDSSGQLAIFDSASTSTVTRVSSVNTNQNLLISATGRRMASFYNDSTAALYLKLGTTAVSSTGSQSYTVKVATNAFYELPHPVYTGAIDGIWDATNGAVLITEIT